MTLAPDDGIAHLISLARQEDLGDGDITTALLPGANAEARFDLIAKQDCILAGCAIVQQVLDAYDPKIQLRWSSSVQDGVKITTTPATLATLQGPLRSVLATERVLLNFLQHLCGVATLTNAFVRAVAGTGAAVYDTRKTIPGWRTLDKYAVRCGGGRNHRQGLFDAVLLKDNHLAGIPVDRLASTVFEMLNRIAGLKKDPQFVEVEAVNIGQVRELCKVVGVDVILLDNFSVSQMEEAVHYRDSIGLQGKVELEASGGVNLQTVRAIAESGVERISVGAITHSAPAIDLSLERL